VFCWIPSHVGIHGNTKADSAAKQALLSPITDFKISYTDLEYSIAEYAKHLWQVDWDGNVNNKLHGINPVVNKTQNVILKRRDEIVITSCRIGHSWITHSFLSQREEPPKCVFCQCPLTVKHILTECGDVPVHPVHQLHL
jgi:polyribonucleotide nucleotidyltransferase